MLPQPSMTRRPAKDTCFIGVAPLHAASRSAGGTGGWGGRQGRVAHLDQPRPIEAVECGAQAGAIGAELPDLDPVAFRDIGGQEERSAHAVGAVAGRAEQREAAKRLAGAGPSGRISRTG